jgi:hypothetical protein
LRLGRAGTPAPLAGSGPRRQSAGVSADDRARLA